MADEPISLLPAGTEIDNADLVVYVQAGTTKHGTKVMLLTAGTAESLKLTGLAGTIIEIVAAGDLNITLGAGKKITIAANGGGISIDSAGLVAASSPVGTPTVLGYKAGAPGNWIVPPTQVQLAIDRIAQRVVVPAAGPIA